MSRFTAEHCKDIAPNKFDLVILASQRARDLSAGITPLLNVKSKNSVVIALWEIASGKVDMDDLKRLVIRKSQLNITDFGYVPEFVCDSKEDDPQSNAESIKNDANDIFFGDDDIETNK